MPIPFSCECGKKMTAKEEFAGRRLRCPECQRVVTIPRPAPAAAPNGGKSGHMLAPQPTLTREEVAALLRSGHDTPAPSKTMPVPPPPRRSDLFPKPAVLKASPPKAAPPPMAAPVAAPAAAPLAAPIVKPSSPAKVLHPWVDTSLSQCETPWAEGDEQRYQTGVRPAREWSWPVGWLVTLAAVGGFAVWALTPP